MKVKDLVIGGRYRDKAHPRETLIYLGIVESGLYEGEHGFDEEPQGDGEYPVGAICTDEEIETDIEPKT